MGVAVAAGVAVPVGLDVTVWLGVRVGVWVVVLVAVGLEVCVGLGVTVWVLVAVPVATFSAQVTTWLGGEEAWSAKFPLTTCAPGRRLASGLKLTTPVLLL